MRTRFLFFALLSLAVTLACNKPDEPEPDPPPSAPQEACNSTDNAFNEKVLPVFQSSCAMSGCHSNASAAGGYKLNSYDNIVQSIEGNEALFLASINFEGNEFSWMPRSNANDPALPEDKLPEDDIWQIECWISRGMPND